MEKEKLSKKAYHWYVTKVMLLGNFITQSIQILLNFDVISLKRKKIIRKSLSLISNKSKVILQSIVTEELIHISIV